MKAFRASAWAACVLVAACSSAPLTPPNDPASPTGGLGLSLWYAQIPTGQYQLFEVDSDGTFRYGGGMEAFNRHTDWSGTLTAAEGRALREAVDRGGWMTAEKPGFKSADSPLAEFKLYAGGHTRTFEIRGPDPAVQALVESMQAVASQRFDRFLQRLPEGGPQTR